MNNFLTLLQTTAPEHYVNSDSLRLATEQFVATLKEDPSTTLQQLGEDAIQFGLKVVAAIVIYFIGGWIIKKIKQGLNRYFNRRNTEKAIASFTSSFVSITLTILLIIIVIGTLGINTTSLAALLAAGGMAIGMALSGTVQNFAGGIMILIFKPFKTGDFIEAQGYSGTVTDVNIVSTKLTTTDNRVIIIPNGALSSGNVDNYSQKEVRRVEFRLPMCHGTDAEALTAKLKEMAKADSRVIDSSVPEASDPFVTISELSLEKVEFMLRVWVKADDLWPLYYDLNMALYTELPKAGFRFATPKLEISK